MEVKSQHFLLSKQARSLSVKRITRLSDDEAFAEYVAIRFADNGGEPKCDRCGSDKPYFISTRRKWKCSNKACQRHFSPTTETPFASRKLSYRDILIAIALFAKAPKGMSAIRLSHELEVWYKTAFVLLHKLREQVGIEQHRHALEGAVEIDGAYFGGHVRPYNNKPLRKDRRLLPHQSGKRQCVTIMRERGGRSRAFLSSEADAARLLPEIVAPGSVIYADESPAYNRLHGRYDVRRVNHDKMFAKGDVSTNHAESSHSRLRRAEMGINHHVAGAYLAAYANEMSWREDNNRRDDLEKFDALTRMMTRGGVSRQWKGYWQRRKAA